jgi:hypothetical protein
MARHSQSPRGYGEVLATGAGQPVIRVLVPSGAMAPTIGRGRAAAVTHPMIARTRRSLSLPLDAVEGCGVFESVADDKQARFHCTLVNR